MPIFDFKTPAVIGRWNSRQQANQQVLRQIGVTIQNYEREQLAERSITMENNLTYTRNGIT